MRMYIGSGIKAEISQSKPNQSLPLSNIEITMLVRKPTSTKALHSKPKPIISSFFQFQRIIIYCGHVSIKLVQKNFKPIKIFVLI